MAFFDMAHRLVLLGYKGELIDFDNLLVDLWWNEYEPKYSTTEMLLHHCTVAREFCDEIRRRAQIWCEDSEILLRLTNIRKSGYLSASRIV